jgi:hypothetical protein
MLEVGTAEFPSFAEAKCFIWISMDSSWRRVPATSCNGTQTAQCVWNPWLGRVEEET